MHRDGASPRGLCRVYDQQQTVLFCKVGNKCEVGGVAGDVGRPGDDDGLGVGSQQLLELLIAQHGAVIHPHKTELCSLLPQAVKGPQDGVVLTDRGNDMIRRADQPAEGRVQCLGRVGGKGDARRTLRAEQFGQRGAGVVDQPRRMKGRLVGTAAGVARRQYGQEY